VGGSYPNKLNLETRQLVPNFYWEVPYEIAEPVLGLDRANPSRGHANVMQFVDYSTKVISKGRELYKSADGALAKNTELETASTRLQSLSGALHDSLHCNQKGSVHNAIGKGDQALEDICGRCVEVSKELVGRLEKLKVPADHKYREWKSFRQALKAVWGREKTEEMATRLAKLREELETHVLIELR